jgi:hypothetical protein
MLGKATLKEGESKTQHLEHFDKDEDLGFLEVDSPSTRNARYDGIYDRLPGDTIVVAYFEFDLVLFMYVMDVRRPYSDMNSNYASTTTYAELRVRIILLNERFQNALRE